MRNPENFPPLPALRVFECVGRRQSFREAGEELCISQSAVSYHIKALEDYLDARLFQRHARGITFTPEGAKYFDVVRESFRLVEDGTIAFRKSTAAQILKVSVLPSFAAGWLVRRLNRFTAEWPGIEVVLDATRQLVDLNRGQADVAIRYGMGDWAGTRSELLLHESLCPVLSPDLLRQGPAVLQPADILRHTLLCVSRPYEWTLWASALGLDISGARTMQLADYNIVLQAAVDGLGIALGRRLLISSRLNEGSLVAVTDKQISPSQLGYWICLPDGSVNTAARNFADWLRREVEL